MHAKHAVISKRRSTHSDRGGPMLMHQLQLKDTKTQVTKNLKTMKPRSQKDVLSGLCYFPCFFTGSRHSTLENLHGGHRERQCGEGLVEGFSCNLGRSFVRFLEFIVTVLICTYFTSYLGLVRGSFNLV